MRIYVYVLLLFIFLPILSPAFKVTSHTYLSMDLGNYFSNKVIKVPGNYSLLQDAINSAEPGTTIVLGNGTYACGVSIYNKRDLRIVGSSSTIFVMPEAMGTCFIIESSYNISISNIVITGNNTYNGLVFRIIGSKNITLTNITLRNLRADLLEVADTSRLSLINIYADIDISFIDIINLTYGLFINTTLNFSYGVSYIDYSSNIYFINSTIHSKLMLWGSSHFIFINTRIYGELHIFDNITEFFITSTFINVYLNNRPIIVIDNEDFHNTSLLENYGIHTISILVLRNVKNLIIEHCTIDPLQDPSITLIIYGSSNIVVRNTRVRYNSYIGIARSKNIMIRDIGSGSIAITLSQNIKLEDITCVSIYMLNSYKVNILNVTETSDFSITFINRSRNIVIDKLYVNPMYVNYSIYLNRLPAYNELDPFIISDTPKLYVCDSTNVFINNSITPILILESSKHVTVQNTKITLNLGLLFNELLLYTNITWWETERPSLNYNELFNRLYNTLSTLKLENVTVGDKPVILLTPNTLHGNTIEYTGQASEIIVFNTSGIIIHNISGLNSVTPLYIINSRNLDIYLLNLPQKYVWIIDSKNISTYLCDLSDAKLYYINSTITLFSRDLYVYEYKGKAYISKLGNYWGELSEIVDFDNDGILDMPVQLGSIADFYPLVNPIEDYKIIGKINELIVTKKLLPKTDFVSKKLSIEAVFKYRFNVRIILSNTTYSDIVAEYKNLYGEKLLIIDLSKYSDGFYTITIMAYVDNLLKYAYNKTFNIHIDNTSPKISIITPANNTFYYGGKITIEWSIIESYLVEMILYIDGKPVNVTGTNKYELNINELEIGRHNITIIAVDKAGNIGRVTIFIEKRGVGPLSLEQGLLLIITILAIIFIIAFCIYRRKTKQK